MADDREQGPTPEGTRSFPDRPKRSRTGVFAKGELIDRFVAVEEIGRGGVGVVIKAFDPNLERWVALKLLRRVLTPLNQERFLREAQAIAKVSSTNVVAVYDVGVWHEELYIAMEYVGGLSLRAWWEAEKRDLPAILDVFAQAGRGLRDAHANGVVHRDFKPDNVLIGDDGRVRVLDFGLARLLERDTSVEVESHEDPLQLTQTGAVMGTPAYMAPEQYRGEPSDARTDQYAFCVSLYEAIAGRRPFTGATLAELKANILAGTPPPLEGAPAPIAALIGRGLSLRPEDRFPSLEDVVRELERHPLVARRKRAAAMIAAACAVGVGGMAAFVMPASPAAICKRSAEKMSMVWNDERSDQLARSFEGSGRAHAEETHRRASSRLDDYAAGWRAMHAETCEATHARGEQSAELLDLRMSCLDRRLGSMRALVSELTTTSTQVVDKAVEAVLALDPIEGCKDREQLRAAPQLPSDPSQREKIEALRPRIDELDALHRTGQYRRGLALAPEVAKDARTIGYPPVRAKVLSVVSNLYQAASQFKEAETATLELTRAAAEARDDALIASTWQDIVFVIGHGRHDPKRAAVFVPVAEAATVRASPDPHLEAKLHNTLGSLAYSRGAHEEAAKEFAQAVALWSKAGASSERFVANALGNQATALEELAKLDEAQAIFERALALKEKLLGSKHPNLGTALEGLANVAKSRGDFERSNHHQRRALALYLSVYGEESNDVSRVLYSIGWNEKELGNYEEAERSLRRSIEIQEKLNGKDHPGLGHQWNGLGDLYVYQKKLEPARDCFLRALSMWEKIDHPDIAIPLANLGDLSNRTGRWQEALGFCTRALTVDEKALGVDHPDLAFDLTCLGEAHLGEGSRAAALPVLERALKLRINNDVTATDRAATQLALAKALQGGTRARALAQAARDTFAAAGKPGEDKLAIAEKWLLDHR